jgi:hypothetical protein
LSGPTQETAEQRAGAAGLVFVLLFVIALVIVPNPPESGAPAREIQHHFAEHAGAIRASTYFGVLSVIFFIALLAGLRSRISRFNADVFAGIAFGAGLLLAGLSMVAAVVSLTLAAQAPDLGLDAVRSTYGLVSFYPAIATGVVLALAGAVGIAALRNGALPAWVGYVSLAYAGYEVLESFTVLATSGTFEPGGVVNGFGTVIFAPWAACASVALLRS